MYITFFEKKNLNFDLEKWVLIIRPKLSLNNETKSRGYESFFFCTGNHLKMNFTYIYGYTVLNPNYHNLVKSVLPTPN